MVDELSGLSLFGLGQRSGDIDHGQQCEHIGLDKAGEEVKVAAEHGGNAVGQEGEIGENTGDVQQTGNAHHGGK